MCWDQPEVFRQVRVVLQKKCVALHDVHIVQNFECCTLSVFPCWLLYKKIDPQGKRRRRDDKSSSSSSNRSPTSPPRSSKRTELLLKVHFDDYTSRWDEQYGEPEWKEEKLAPLYSKARQ